RRPQDKERARTICHRSGNFQIFRQWPVLRTAAAAWKDRDKALASFDADARESVRRFSQVAVGHSNPKSRTIATWFDHAEICVGYMAFGMRAERQILDATRGVSFESRTVLRIGARQVRVKTGELTEKFGRGSIVAIGHEQRSHFAPID